MKRLYLAPVGPVAGPVLEWLEPALGEWFRIPVGRLEGVGLPDGPGAVIKGQHQSVEVMKRLAGAAPADGLRVLGVTEVDLSIPVLTFLFGQAQLDGAVAVVSLHRLRQEFYGLPADEELLRERLKKEVLHEMGHTFGLVHCAETWCAMSLSTHIGLVDTKRGEYCAACARRLERKLAALGIEE